MIIFVSHFVPTKMSGHNKWSKIKNQKAVTDARKSKIFTKMVRLITVEAKKSKGMMSPGLKTVVDKAKSFNVPNDTIDRAVKKASTDNGAAMEAITYEAYGPGGVALIIEALTENRNKAAGEVKHILSEAGSELAAIGSASWAFTRSPDGTWTPNMTLPLSDEDYEKLEKLVDALEDNDEVQDVYTNAE
ncbi:MAG: YebC/PmpR family DNA-binding transcriptional regulator [bacterium]